VALGCCRILLLPDSAAAALYDLSHLRLALNGAEPIDEATVANFVSAGAWFGMRPECVLGCCRAPPLAIAPPLAGSTAAGACRWRSLYRWRALPLPGLPLAFALLLAIVLAVGDRSGRRSAGGRAFPVRAAFVRGGAGRFACGCCGELDVSCGRQ
jgi:hypothetical protein